MGDFELDQSLKVLHVHQEVANLKLYKLLDSTVFERERKDCIELHARDRFFYDPKIRYG